VCSHKGRFCVFVFFIHINYCMLFIFLLRHVVQRSFHRLVRHVYEAICDVIEVSRSVCLCSRRSVLHCS